MDLSMLTTNNGMTLELVIWSLFIGLSVGAAATVYVRRVLGSFIRRLLETQATSPDSAKTLDESGLTKNALVRAAVSRSLRTGGYRGVVRLAPADAPAAVEGKIKSRNISAIRFFIPEEKVYRAGQLYDFKDSSILIALIAILAFLIVALLSLTVVPDLIQMFSNVTGVSI